MTDQDRPGWRRAIGPLAAAIGLLLLWATLQFEWIHWTRLGNWARSQAPRIAVLLGAAAFAVIGGLAWWRTPKRAVQRSGLSWWVVLAAAAAVAMTAWAATEWLLSEADGAVDRGSARVNAIKTGLGIGAGATGVFALLLAVRRQTHQEHTAADTSFDAAEKRVTELYTKAVEQLGSGRAAVRLGGLYALERLAQGNPEHRQTIVNVMCAYLRMHYDIPGDPPEATTDKDVREGFREQVQEREVRLTAQRILHDHLQPSHPDTLWEPISVDLTSAYLIDFALTNCRVHDAKFVKAIFVGQAHFDRASFTGHAWFGESNFTDGTTFDGAVFADGAWFGKASFAGAAWFGKASFAGVARFDGVIFPDLAWFDQTRFAGGVWFDAATFTSDASFSDATFAGNAHFNKATFTDDARFDQASFVGSAGFNEATFTGSAWFDLATFTGSAGFAKATFNGLASFVGAAFTGRLRFDDATFIGPASFERATLRGTAYSPPQPGSTPGPPRAIESS